MLEFSVFFRMATSQMPNHTGCAKSTLIGFKEIRTYLLLVALMVFLQIIHAAACSGAGNSVKKRQTSAVLTDEPPNLVLFFGLSSLLAFCSGSEPQGVAIVVVVSCIATSCFADFGVEVCGMLTELDAKGENPNGVEFAENVSLPAALDAILGVDKWLALVAAASAAKTFGNGKCGNAVELLDGAPWLLDAAAT